MRSGSYRQLYHPDQMISGSEDAANNFARGYNSIGRIVQQVCENRIRKEFENSDYVQGFHIFRSLGGGSGAGFTVCLLEILFEYPKTTKLDFAVHPSPQLSCSIVEPYNCILSEHFSMEDIDISILIDNESLYDIMVEKIDVKEPTFHQINRLVAQVCSSLTASTRFENELNNEFSILTNLIPYPRIHFPLVGYAPFGSEAKLSHDTITISEITRLVFDSKNQLAKCNPATGRYMSCSLVYRGEININHVYNALSDIKASRSVSFVDWCPTGFKVGIVSRPPIVIQNSLLGNSVRNVVMITNNSAVSVVWHRLAQRFHKLYAKRSFIHWFIGEGLEENEFAESLYNLATLAKDYEEVALDTNLDELFDDSKTPNPENPSAGENYNVKEVLQNTDSDNQQSDKEKDENFSNVTKSQYSFLNADEDMILKKSCKCVECLKKSFHENYSHSVPAINCDKSHFSNGDNCASDDDDDDDNTSNKEDEIPKDVEYHSTDSEFARNSFKYFNNECNIDTDGQSHNSLISSIDLGENNHHMGTERSNIKCKDHHVSFRHIEKRREHCLTNETYFNCNNSKKDFKLSGCVYSFKTNSKTSCRKSLDVDDDDCEDMTTFSLMETLIRLTSTAQ